MYVFDFKEYLVAPAPFAGSGGSAARRAAASPQTKWIGKDKCRKRGMSLEKKEKERKKKPKPRMMLSSVGVHFFRPSERAERYIVNERTVSISAVWYVPQQLFVISGLNWYTADNRALSKIQTEFRFQCCSKNSVSFVNCREDV